MSNAKIGKTIGALLVVVGVGLALGWLTSRSPKAQPQVNDNAQAADTNAPSEAVTPKRVVIKTSVDSRPSAERAAAAVPEVNPNLITDWEERLDNILGDDKVEDPVKAKHLLEMFPNLPEEGQVDVAQHLANLTPDSDYAPLGKYLSDPKTPEAVVDILMGDLLNRGNTVKLPMLVEVAKNESSPKAEEAKNILELYLEEDYGTDWATWQAKVDEWLKANPD
jgi:hypothetical protein